MSGFNSFQPSVGTSASFWDPSLQMSDGSDSGRRFSCASAGFKLSQALAQSAWENKKRKEKKRMVTGEIVVIAFKPASRGRRERGGVALGDGLLPYIMLWLGNTNCSSGGMKTFLTNWKEEKL